MELLLGSHVSPSMLSIIKRLSHLVIKATGLAQQSVFKDYSLGCFHCFYINSKWAKSTLNSNTLWKVILIQFVNLQHGRKNLKWRHFYVFLTTLKMGSLWVFWISGKKLFTNRLPENMHQVQHKVNFATHLESLQTGLVVEVSADLWAHFAFNVSILHKHKWTKQRAESLELLNGFFRKVLCLPQFSHLKNYITGLSVQGFAAHGMKIKLQSWKMKC